MRKIVICTALWFATIAGGIALGGANAHATTSAMYYDADGYVLASAGGCTAAATDDSCA